MPAGDPMPVRGPVPAAGPPPAAAPLSAHQPGLAVSAVSAVPPAGTSLHHYPAATSHSAADHPTAHEPTVNPVGHRAIATRSEVTG